MSTTSRQPDPASVPATHSTPNPAPDPAPAPQGLAAELTTVRSLEASIAERLDAARGSRDVVLSAAREAEEILETARAEADEAAEAARDEIQAAATRGAERIRMVAEEQCATIAAGSARQRDSDVAVLVSGVLPMLPSSVSDRMDGAAGQVRGQGTVS